MNRPPPPSKTVPAALAGARLDIALRELFGVSRRHARRLIADGAVFVDKRRVRVQSRLVGQGDSLSMGELPDRAPIELPVIYEDADLVVVNKPSGVPTAPTRQGAAGTVTEILRNRGVRAEPVHRLDVQTSGVLALAKSANVASALSAQFRARVVRRTYLAVVAAAPFTSTVITDPLLPPKGGRALIAPEGKSAETAATVLARTKSAALILLEPATGRSHQLRAHLASRGAPILGDTLYGSPARTDGAFGLHATALSLADELFVAALPDSLRATIELSEETWLSARAVCIREVQR